MLGIVVSVHKNRSINIFAEAHFRVRLGNFGSPELQFITLGILLSTTFIFVITGFIPLGVHPLRLI